MLFFKVELANVCLGLLSHLRGCRASSVHVASILPCPVSGCHSQNSGGPRRPASVPCIGATLTAVKRKAATKVVRPTSDRGSRCTDNEQSKKTEDRTLNFCHQAQKTASTVLQSQNLFFIRESGFAVAKHLMMGQQRYHARI